MNPGDPLTPGLCGCRTQAAVRGRGEEHYENSGAADFVWRCATVAGGLKGPMAPEKWRGTLPIPYHVGPGPAKIHLKVAFNWDIKPVHDVIAKIPGAVAPDEWVIRGNHHDAWVNGAEDPVSGQAPLLEEARGLWAAAQARMETTAHDHLRAWDGEEPMLLGSTEWVETHAEELRQQAAVYINSRRERSRAAQHGRIAQSGAIHQWSCARYRRSRGQDVVWERANCRRLRRPSPPTIARNCASAGICESMRWDQERTLRDSWTIWVLQRSISGYDGETEQGIYHSIYDDFYWYMHFSDSRFCVWAGAVSNGRNRCDEDGGCGSVALDFVDLADTVQAYTKELEKLLADKQEEIRERNLELDEGVFKATLDPRRPTIAPAREEIPPHLNFAPMQNAVDSLTRSAERYRKALSEKQSVITESQADSLRALNAKLIESERKLTNEDGLPRRAWYKHLLYAPGVYTGYGVKTVPGVREGIEQKKYAEAEEETARVAKALQEESALIESAAGLVEQAGK